MEILDIHSHRAAPDAVCSLSLAAPLPALIPGCAYSAGIHPWDTMAPVSDETVTLLKDTASRPEVVAIGECGVDALRGGPLFRQINILKAQIELSEGLRKPLVIHDVKAHDIILGLHREMNPAQPWAIHGFRYKPSVAAMFTGRGIYLSFGPVYNKETLLSTPRELILAETDDRPDATIRQVIASLTDTLGADTEPIVAANTFRFLTK